MYLVYNDSIFYQKAHSRAERTVTMKTRIIAFALISAIIAGLLFSGCSKDKLQAQQLQDKIGIIGAMDVEVQTLKDTSEIESTKAITGMEFCEGRLGNKNVVIVKCGMGKVNAGVCANILINHFGCTKIINTGVAGSLDNKIDIGDVIVSVDAVQHDFDASPLGFANGEIPYTGLYAFKADEALRQAAVKAVKESAPGKHVFEGRICSGDQFIAAAEKKNKIINDFGGLCCEMEGGAIAQVCYLCNVPFVIIRTVSDKPDETEIVEYKDFEAEAAAMCADIVSYMVQELL